ncbi:hypothetical protein GPECTOR_49g541 [Gonium pectorale]|uniref:Peptidase S8/S53 domain-containing protein n=1 Tax=Gonium pectorale TaxID=33097 RepID=A0A150G7Y3_GONPE|nr:hypothetical protein GPECTOR_49g541 [Gonium pectorale]|eukprot:KXZ45957.1 hypothetical protein GPECTOR_49g541 [Gonium pectorale]
MLRLIWLCSFVFFSSARLSRAQGGSESSQAHSEHLAAFLRGPGAGLGVHQVHLRTGILDVGAEHERLPAPTAAARRLLQQSSHAPARSPGWGPLAGAQLWLLTLGPKLHHHLDAHPPEVQQRGQAAFGHLQQHNLISAAGEAREGGPAEGPAAAAAAGSPGAAGPSGAPLLPEFAERQAALLARLHSAGCAVVSFLPPAAWLVVVAEGADLAALREEQPDVRLAPYGPAAFRVSPEMGAALEAVRAAGPAAAEALAAGQRIDELLAAAQRQEGGRQAGGLAGGQQQAQLQQAEQAAGVGAGDGVGDGGSPTPRVLIEVHFPHLEPEDIRNLLAAAASGQGEGEAGSGAGSWAGEYHPSSAAAADWLAPLSALSPDSCPPLLYPDSGSPELLLVAVCPQALEDTVEWLAAAPQVSWLAPRMSARLHNLVAGAIVQTGGRSAAVVANASSLSAHPFWAAGLDGRNQVVGCGDSGMDLGNCFFADTAVPFMQNVATNANGQQYFLSDSHRKLRYYLAVVQDLFDGFGHGTHVAGTLVGSRYAPGVAYVRIASGPSGLIASRALTFGLTALRGADQPDSPPSELRLAAAGGAGDATALRLEAALAAEAVSPAAIPPGNWSAVTSTQLQLTAPSDGAYLVAVRPLGSSDPTTWATATVTVDTTPPVVAITRKPASIQSDPRVTIAFGDAGAEGDIRAFLCRWQGPAAAPPDPAAPDTGETAFAACSGSSTAGNVTEGYWLFQVKAAPPA